VLDLVAEGGVREVVRLRGEAEIGREENGENGGVGGWWLRKGEVRGWRK
jgi:hypothetical protein